jgi:hypothetical protein
MAHPAFSRGLISASDALTFSRMCSFRLSFKVNGDEVKDLSAMSVGKGIYFKRKLRLSPTLLEHSSWHPPSPKMRLRIRALPIILIIAVAFFCCSRGNRFPKRTVEDGVEIVQNGPEPYLVRGGKTSASLSEEFRIDLEDPSIAALGRPQTTRRLQIAHDACRRARFRGTPQILPGLQIDHRRRERQDLGRTVPAG